MKEGCKVNRKPCEGIFGRLTERLLLEEEEDSVQQFQVLREVVQLSMVSRIANTICEGPYVVENDQLVGPSARFGANGIEYAVSDNRWDQLLGKERQENAADDGQVEIVNLEQPIQLHRRSIAHQLASTKDYDVVGYQDDGSLWECRHWRLALDEAKVLRLVAFGGFERFLEEGP